MIAGETTPQVLLEAENIPQEMKTYRAWVVHRSKIPHDPLSGLRASSTDSRTWRSFDEAEAALEIGQGAYDGIGFVFSSGDPYTGIDLDDCRDPETGEITPWAQKIVDTFAEEGYVEASPSGTGVHIIIVGTLEECAKTKHVEVYDRCRFFTITGRAL